MRGSTVRINISKGQQTIGVPNVIGRRTTAPPTQLRRAGFTAVRQDVEASSRKGRLSTRIRPRARCVPPGTRVTLSVSTGQSTTAVPDVRGLDEGSAQATLDNEGWEVVDSRHADAGPDEDGIVISQTPPPGGEAEPGSRVTIFVGRLEHRSRRPRPRSRRPRRRRRLLP